MPMYALAQTIESDNYYSKGLIAFKNSDLQSALSYFEKADSIDKLTLTSKYTNRKSYSSLWVGYCYYKLGKLDKAQEANKYYWAKPVDRNLTIESDNYVELADSLANEHDNYTEAIKLYKKCKKLWEDLKYDYHPYYANLILNISLFCYYNGDIKESYEYYNIGHDLLTNSENLGDDYYEVLYFGMFLNMKKDNYKSAISLGKELISYCNAKGNKERLGTAYCDMGDVYNNMDSLALASTFKEKGIEILRSVENADEERIEKEENTLYSIYKSSKKYEKCIEVLTQQNKRYSTSGKLNSNDYQDNLKLISSLYSKLNDSKNAINIQNQYVDIQKKNNNKENLATGLDDLARFYEESGEHSTARDIIENSLSIFHEIGDTISSNYMSALNTSANIYSSLLLWNKASVSLGKSLEIGESYDLEGSSEYLRTLNIAMVIANIAGQNDIAKNLNLRVLKHHLSKESGVDSLLIATDLQNMGSILTDQGKYDEAIGYQYKAMQIRYNHLPHNHPELAHSYNACAHLLCKMGEYETALQYENLVVDIMKQLGIHNKLYSLSLRNRAEIYLNLNDHENAMKDIIEVISNYNAMIRNEFSSLSPIEQKHYWREYKYFYEKKIPNYTSIFNHPFMNAAAYDAFLVSKGILLNSEMALNQIVLNSSNKSLLNTYNEIRNLQDKISSLYKQPLEEREENVNKLEIRLEELQRKLVKESKDFGDHMAYMNTSLDSIQANLDLFDVAIEFNKSCVDSLNTKYIALITTKDLYFPILVELCNEEELFEYVKGGSTIDTKIYELIWSPIMSHISGKKNIYFSASGLLHNISIENAIYPNGKLLSEDFAIYRLSSTRELVTSKSVNNNSNTYLYGNINYEASIDEIRDANTKNNRLKGLASTSEENNYLFPINQTRGVVDFSPLAGTKNEIDNISKIIINSKVYQETQATEESIKILSGNSPNILHIGTHGVYYSQDDRDSENVDFIEFSDTTTTITNAEEEALSRCALLMAGAQNAYYSPETIPFDMEDGILTAQEISLLDLRHTDFISLSACETAKGDITGDGVFGLQRGFKKAGANTILMSLWKVDDKATCKLMTEFYTNWINKKMTKHNALENAKMSVSKTKGWEDPRYWAAFILLDALN